MRITLSNLKPQTRRVLGELIAGGPAGTTVAKARAFQGVENLSARIAEIRQAGVTVDTMPLLTRPGSRYVIRSLAN